MLAINKAIYSATKEGGCTPEVRFKLKSYWYPELSRLREKTRFWWNLSVQNDRRSVVITDWGFVGINNLPQQVILLTSTQCDTLLSHTPWLCFQYERYVGISQYRSPLYYMYMYTCYIHAV